MATKRVFTAMLILAGSLPACIGPQTSPATGGRTESPPAEGATVAAENLLPNGIEAFPGILVGGQPTLEQLERARRQGVTRVINLRTLAEGGPTAEEVEALGLDYVSIPVAGSEDYTPEKALALKSALAGTGGKVIVHCRSGNRVGALFAIKAHEVDGLTPEEALEIGKRAGLTKAEPEVRRLLGLTGS